MINTSCNNSQQKQQDESKAETSYKEGSFGYDLNFLKQYDSVVVLQAEGENAKVIVSPKYQAKVFTSTAAGDEGISFGWVNYKAFTGTPDGHMNAYGGENRLWLGPEGGKFSLFFNKLVKNGLLNVENSQDMIDSEMASFNKQSQ